MKMASIEQRVITSTAPKRVLVTGATGFIGRKLVARLLERGDRVVVLARDPAKAARLFGTTVEIVGAAADLPAAARLDAFVNLAGDSIAGGLWTARRRAVLVDSRLRVTQALLALAARLETRPAAWLNASAIGYYGARPGDQPLGETAPCGTDFQAELCRRWEEAAQPAEALGIAVARLRFGVVLGRDGGALPSLARPVRWFVGARLGSGRQWVSWIHVHDLLELLLFVLDRADIRGPLNATAPSPVRHAELMRTLAGVLRRPLWPLPVPAWLLRALLGELADLFVAGQRVVPERALALGFEYRFATLEAALRDLL